MSPATPLDWTAAVGSELVIRVPRRTRVGLQLLAAIAWPDAATPPDFEALGWSELARVTIGIGSIAVLRREATDEEPATYTFAFEDVADSLPAGALIVATGVSDAGDASDEEATAIAAGGPELVAPTATADAYSDICLRVFYGDDAGVDVDAAMVLVQAVGTEGAVEGAIAVHWQNPEAAGPVGTYEVDTLVDPIDAIAATFTLPAQIAAIAPQWDDEIAIGLTTIGV